MLQYFKILILALKMQFLNYSEKVKKINAGCLVNKNQAGTECQNEEAKNDMR